MRNRSAMMLPKRVHLLDAENKLFHEFEVNAYAPFYACMKLSAAYRYKSTIIAATIDDALYHTN
eukprot:4921-Heterococcus_DN1.PRE.1